MSENKVTAADLLGQISEFEKTLSSLQNNVIELRSKIIKNRDQFGEDVSTWPKM